MAKSLVLAEKPSVGRELARVLGCKRGGEGYLEGDRYVVTWALGHLVTLADPDVYEKKWEKCYSVLTPDGEIIEIQTGELYPLARKIAFYMEQTDHRITLVHPLIAEKQISWLEPETGELVSRAKSPKKDSVLSGIALLKPFLPYLGDPRFTLLFPFVELEEYRLLDGYGKTRKLRSHRYELIPLALRDCASLCAREDYLSYFPTDLPESFTAKVFAKHTRLRGYALYDALAVFEGLGAIARAGKEGRSTLFTIV